MVVVVVAGMSLRRRVNGDTMMTEVGVYEDFEIKIVICIIKRFCSNRKSWPIRNYNNIQDST